MRFTKLFFGLWLSWLAIAPVATADDRIRIAYASRSISSILPFIANDKGFFKEEALEPQLILTRGTTSMAAAVSGDIEGIHIMGTAIRGIIQGLPLKVLTVNQKVPLFWLVTRPELESFSDLSGKTKDITTFVSGDVPAQLQAQLAGPVHITVLSPPTVFVARDRHKLNLLASMADEYINFISGVIVSERTLHDKPGVIKRALRALAKANRFFHANETATAEILAKYLNVSQQIALETHRYSLPGYTRNGIPTDKEVEEHLKADAQFLKLKEPVKSSAVFDFSLQREVNNELGVK